MIIIQIMMKEMRCDGLPVEWRMTIRRKNWLEGYHPRPRVHRLHYAALLSFLRFPFRSNHQPWSIRPTTLASLSAASRTLNLYIYMYVCFISMIIMISWSLSSSPNYFDNQTWIEFDHYGRKIEFCVCSYCCFGFCLPFAIANRLFRDIFNDIRRSVYGNRNSGKGKRKHKKIIRTKTYTGIQIKRKNPALNAYWSVRGRLKGCAGETMWDLGLCLWRDSARITMRGTCLTRLTNVPPDQQPTNDSSTHHH